MYHTEPPIDKTIREWYMKFQQSGCLCAAKRAGWPEPSAKTVEHVREMFVRSPQKSTYRARRELQMPQSSVWRILRTWLRHIEHL
jgi:transposase